jgi:hypothetical protein
MAKREDQLFFMAKKKFALLSSPTAACHGQASQAQIRQGNGGEGGGGGREIRGNVPWSRTHPFFQEKGMGTVEFGCCDASAHPWKLDLSVGSIGGGRKKFNYTRMLRVVCR